SMAAGIFGAPLSGLLLSLRGTAGLDGWQWLFLVEGLPAIALGLVALAYLDDGPERARWLPDDERAWLVAPLRVGREDARGDAESVKRRGARKRAASGRVCSTRRSGASRSVSS